ncbi:MAG: HAMP domain-containing sensor histidine kinase [Anaerolineae bacterium]
MWRGSLILKLTLAFLLTSVLGIGLAALLARVVTMREFDRFVMGQLRNEYVANAAAYYQSHGSWAGAGEYFHQLELSPQPGAPPRPPQFILVDQAGSVITPVQPYRSGDRIPASELEAGVPVEVFGRIVGTVIDVRGAPALTEREMQYLASTQWALSMAALAAAAVALLVGILLARTLTRPLRDLTHAIEAMARGELRQEVPVRSADELGTLTEAFNKLSSDLARSNELRRQMTADIAHDLRTPLTVINAYIEGLRDGVFQPTPERFDAMHTEAQHLQTLIEDLRILSLADAGELPIQRIPISSEALLERLVAAHAPQAEERGITMRVLAERGLPDILVDPERMAQVLGNLVSNALRYTPSGGQIVLGARRLGVVVALSVQDTGVGIPPDILPHVFDRFYRGDDSRSEQNGGSGLGLAIAKSLAEAQGARIEVASALGQGTTFTVLVSPA